MCGHLIEWLCKGIYAMCGHVDVWTIKPIIVIYRSEEHTSELQSHSDIVCRLLLEKKINQVSRRCIIRARSVNLCICDVDEGAFCICYSSDEVTLVTVMMSRSSSIHIAVLHVMKD